MSAQYRLLSGEHLHSDGRIYEAGQIIASDLDLCALFNRPGYRARFENIAGSMPSNCLAYDPAVESIEAFAARVKAIQAQAIKADGPAQVWDPKVETLNQFFQRMSGGQATPPPPPQLPIVQPSTPTLVTPPSSQEKVGVASLQGGAVTAVSSVKTQQQLDAMTVQDLQRLAEDEEIDLGHAKSKPDIVKVLNAYFRAVQK